MVSEMQSTYSSAKPNGQPLAHYVDVMATSRDWDTLRDAWVDWRDASGKKIRQTYTDFVQLANSMVQEQGMTSRDACTCTYVMV